MQRILKALGAALVAALCLSALSAGAAQASPMFNSEAEETNLTATNTNVHHLSTGTFDITCESVSLTGSAGGTTFTEVTMHPSYSDCHVVIFGFKLSATVNFTSCDYRLAADGDVSLVCKTPGDHVDLAAAGCTYHFPEQTIASGVAYSDNGSHIDIGSTATGISYTQSGSTCGSREGSDGSFTGDLTVEGEDAATGEETTISWSE